VTATATDVDNKGENLTISAVGGLTANLALTQQAGNAATPGTRTATIDGRLNKAAGTYSNTIRVSDGDKTADKPLSVVVTKEDVIVSDFGPSVITVDGTDGDKDGLVVTMVAHEAQDGYLSGGLLPQTTPLNGLANAKPIAVTLTPVGTGSSYTCTAISTTYVASDPDSADASCPLLDVKVNVYEVNATVNGDYFTGSGIGAITVMDPALGFTTGGGWFRLDDGTRVNFGFNAKILKSGQVQGSLLTIFSKGKSNYVAKSNAMGSLAVAKDAAGFYAATFTGKATYAVPPWEPLLYCGARKCGDYRFTAYVEDRKEPGAGSDRFWVEVLNPPTVQSGAAVANVTLPKPAATNAKTIIGGNIQVPQPASQ
jgi:hypothetical protein